MGRTPGTEPVLAAAAAWRDRCFLADGSIFTDQALWTRAHLAELTAHFVEKPDTGDRTFIEKLNDQLAPASPGARQLAAEMLWALLLFPSNVTRERKVAIVTEIWGWSGSLLPPTHPALAGMGDGIGSGGQAFNTYRPLELQFFIQLMEDWKALPEEERAAQAADPWALAHWMDTVEGADKRQFRHMLLHLLFPEQFERMSSTGHKTLVDAAFAERLDAATLGPEEVGTTLIARDRRLLRIRRVLEAERPGVAVDFYEGDLYDRWKPEPAPAAPKPPKSGAAGKEPAQPPAPEPPGGDGEPPHAGPPGFDAILEIIQSIGLRVSARTLRRYHLALESRGFVILSGVSGTGKTWLAEAYGQAANARVLVVPVAPNWTANEDLLGFADPLGGPYRDTPFSRFLREAAAEYAEARRAGRVPRAYHLVLDEMNLARVEYYFATFLSAMEQRMRVGEARIALGPKDLVSLPSSLKFIGTVNVDETTHGFADKVYDRAQVIEVGFAREDLEAHLGGAPYKADLLAVWDAVHPVAPFAFRVLDDAGRYVMSAGPLGVDLEELLDEVILQKILPKVRGTDPRVGDVLEQLASLAAGRYPLSHAKATAMRAAFQQHGVASYF